RHITTPTRVPVQVTLRECNTTTSSPSRRECGTTSGPGGTPRAVNHLEESRNGGRRSAGRGRQDARNGTREIDIPRTAGIDEIGMAKPRLQTGIVGGG